MRPCPNCECFVSVTAKRCPRCEAALEPVVVPEPEPEHAETRELALVGATTDPIVRSVMAHVVLPPMARAAAARPTLPKLPQPFATDPLALAPFLGVPVHAPEPEPPAPEPTAPAVRPADELATDLSPATITAIIDAAAEIATGGVSAAWSPQPDAPADAALERVIARANEIAQHAPAPTVPAETVATVRPGEPEPQLPAVDDDLGRALELAAAAAAATTVVDEPVADRTIEPEAPADARDDEPPAPPAPPASTIVATPLAAPVVLTVPEGTAKAPRRKWFTRRDAFTRRFTRRERVLAKACAWLVVALAVSILALKLPVGARPQLGATAPAVGPSIGTPESPVTSPFADAIRIQTQADLRVVVATASSIDAFWSSFLGASPVVLGRALPQFAFVAAPHASVRVGQLSVATSPTRVVFAEYAGPKGCAYARLVAHQNAQVVIGSTGAPCRASTPPARGWKVLGQG